MGSLPLIPFQEIGDGIYRTAHQPERRLVPQGGRMLQALAKAEGKIAIGENVVDLFIEEVHEERHIIAFILQVDQSAAGPPFKLKAQREYTGHKQAMFLLSYYFFLQNARAASLHFPLEATKCLQQACKNHEALPAQAFTTTGTR